MNKPLFAFGISLLLLGIGMLYGVSVVAQPNTVCSGNLWTVYVDGVPLNNRFQLETTMTDAMTTAGMENPGAVITSSLSRECRQTLQMPEPEIVEVPGPERIVEVEKIVEVIVEVPGPETIIEVPVIQEVIVEVPVSDPVPVSIPGGANWVPVPGNMTVQGFRQINNHWVTGGSRWLYVFEVGQDFATGFLVRNTNSAGVQLTEAQIAEVLAAIIESGS